MKDINLFVAAIVIVCGLLGMYAHWYSAKRNGRKINRSFLKYLFADNPAGTGKTVFVFGSAIGGLFSLGSFDAVQLDAAIAAMRNYTLYAPLAQAIVLAVTTGYTCDSVLNDGVKNDG